MNNMEKYIQSSNHDFKIFKLDYTKEELDCLSSLNIIKEDTFIHVGSIDAMTNIHKFLKKCINNDEKQISMLETIIMRLLMLVLRSFKTKYYWMDIRVTLPNNKFDIPRWHKDGRYFRKSDKQSPKFGTTLVGPGTLLIKNTKKIGKLFNHIRDLIFSDVNKLENKSISEMINVHDKYRPFYVKELDKMKIIQVKNNEGVIFYPQLNLKSIEGALHSEPKMDTPRIFISILPGSEIDINELKKHL